MLWICTIGFLYILGDGLIYAASTDDDFSSLMTLPPEFSQKLNDTDAEKLKNKYLDTFKKKCEQNNHPEAFETAQKSVDVLTKCLQAQVDIKLLESEVEEAKPEGRVDEVFKKYCNKSPQFLQCLDNMLDALKPCFSVDEQKQIGTVHNLTAQLGEFICHKDGERIALFIAEGGKECFQEKQAEIQSCFNQTFDQKSQDSIKDVAFNFVDSPILKFDEEQCDQMTKLQKCFVSTLETCEQPTTANIVESLFKFIRKSTPCKQKSDTGSKRTGPNSSPGLAMTSTTLVTSLALLLMM